MGLYNRNFARQVTRGAWWNYAMRRLREFHLDEHRQSAASYFPNAPYSSSPTGSSHSLLVSAPAGSNVTWLK